MSSFIIKSSGNSREPSNEKTFDVASERSAIVIRLCVCIQAPNGDYGLHGYMQTKKYKVQYMGIGVSGNPYVRLYKDYDIDKDDNKYDTVSVFNYQYYFKTFGIDENRGKPEARSKRK